MSRDILLGRLQEGQCTVCMISDKKQGQVDVQYFKKLASLLLINNNLAAPFYFYLFIIFFSQLGESFDETTPDGREVVATVTFEDGKIVTVQKAKKEGQKSTRVGDTHLILRQG